MSGRFSRIEQLLLVATPAAAMAAVALGLRIGARGPVRAAIVRGAPPSGAGTGLAWTVLVFDEERGAREPAARVPLDVTARARDAAGAEVSATWRGVTNEDGAAEALLAVPGAGPVSLDVGSGGAVLAEGEASAPPIAARATAPGWVRFARREGAIALDVALPGGRAAPGFLADLRVRATDAATHDPLPGVSVGLDLTEGGESLGVGAAPQDRRTDSRGWTRVDVLPAGLAVTVALRARAANGRGGAWIGGLTMSPGAPRVAVADRVDPGAPVQLDVTTPTVRASAYVEIDDARGRAWAAAPALTPRPDGMAQAGVEAPALAPGLYQVVAAADPASAAALEAGTTVRPFFVAPTDDAALALGAQANPGAVGAGACTPPRDPRESTGAVATCLALAPFAPVPRWTALDGFARERALDGAARARGLAVALGALAVAVVLEAVLLLRASFGGRARHFRTVAVAVLVGLLGFALLAAFLVRV